MCLVIGKPKGASIPSKRKLRRIFREHPDGFGVSFQYKGMVRTIKGAMTPHDMLDLLAKVRGEIAPNTLESIDAVLQWRKAVTGSVSQKYCHPFPITADQEELDSLDTISELSLAHNGVIWDYNWAYSKSEKASKGDINDAQEFIKDYLVGMGNRIFEPAIQKLIEAYTDSKFAILSPKGISYIGSFIKERGCYYSNMNHKFTYSYYDPSESLDPYKYKRPVATKKRSVPQTAFSRGKAGILCELCNDYVDVVYECEELLVCLDCFRNVMGREPNQLKKGWEEVDMPLDLGV